MKQITLCQCEFCGSTFELASDCMIHEAAHLGLNKDEYFEWKRLIHEVRSATVQVNGRTNKNRSRYMNATRLLDKFEKDHALDSSKVPFSFYLM